MAKILHIKEYQTKISEKKAFGPWEKRFKERYTHRSLLQDISDKTLYSLSFPGKESTNAFYELILGVFDYGGVSTFYSLSKLIQLTIIDIHLFALDQIRFEMMYRLQWIPDYPTRKIPVINIVTRYESLNKMVASKPMILCSSHPEYETFIQLCDREKEAFIRKQIPDALDQFKKRFS